MMKRVEPPLLEESNYDIDIDIDNCNVDGDDGVSTAFTIQSTALSTATTINSTVTAAISDASDSCSGSGMLRSSASGSGMLRSSLSVSARGDSTHSRRSKSRAYQPVSAFSSNTSAVFDELNRLRFAALGLYGRQPELQMLDQALVRHLLPVLSQPSHLVTSDAVSDAVSDPVSDAAPAPSVSPPPAEPVDDQHSESPNTNANANANANASTTTTTTTTDDGEGTRSPEKPLNLVLVAGKSGVGKTALVKEFQNRIQQRQTKTKTPVLTIANGKYDQHTTSMPYGGFISAFSQICNDVRSHPLYQSKIQEDILKAVGLGEDYKLLLDLIPNLGELVYEAKEALSGKNNDMTDDQQHETLTAPTTTTTTTTTTASYNIVKAKEKFKFLLQRFLHAVCQPEHKIVLFLDDIQWMDSASLKLLETILSDRALEDSILVVAVYRDEEQVKREDPSSSSSSSRHNFMDNLSVMLNRVQKKRSKTPTTIVLHNLSLQTMESYIADLLKLDTHQVRDLANIAYQRVDGNIFFLIQFFTALKDGGYLRYNIGTMKWIWDDAEIRKSTVVASNVLAVLMEKIQRLPREAKSVLQVVACLGASFEEPLVTLVVTEVEASGLLLSLSAMPSSSSEGENDDEATNTMTNSSATKQSSTEEILYSLQEEGFLEELPDNNSEGSRALCFSHSQIGLAAHGLLDAEFLTKLKFQIGRSLFDNKSDIDYHKLLFNIVDLWNEGKDLVAGSRKQLKILIELNFEAGKKALESSAFGASSHYLQQAIDLIPKSKRWLDEYYDLTLAIYNCLIKAEYSNGSWDLVRKHAAEVIDQNKDRKRPAMDQVAAQTALISLFSIQENKHTDAIDLAIYVLSLLGATFGTGKLGVVGALIKTKMLLNKVPLETLLTQKEMTDQEKLVALDVLATVNSSMYATNPDLMAISVLKSLRWSLKYGVSKETAKSISFYGLVEMALGNLEYGTKACKLAVELAEKQNLMDTEYSPTAAAYGFVLPWTSPLHTCSNRLLSGYNSGLETGDLHYGFINITLYCYFAYCSGKPFASLETDMREYGRQMKEYNQTLQLKFLCLTWQTILNLMGRCEGNPKVLNGEVMDFEEMLLISDKDNNPALRSQVQCHRLELAVYYQDFGLAEQLVGPASNIAMVNPGNPIVWRNALFEGIAAFELVRRGKRRWRSTGINALAKTKKWVDAGNVNCVHILYLLQAEKAAIADKDMNQARQLYDKAIVTAARNGFRNDRALASERCAAMYHGNDEFWFNDYFDKAKVAYTEMEALGKVDHMVSASTSSSSNPRRGNDVAVLILTSDMDIASLGSEPMSTRKQQESLASGTRVLSDLTGIQLPV